MVLSQHQKFHKCQIVTQQLASLASEVGMAEFQQRFTVLKTLKDAWAEGREASVSVDTGTIIYLLVLTSSTFLFR